MFKYLYHIFCIDFILFAQVITSQADLPLKGVVFVSSVILFQQEGIFLQLWL